MAITGRSQTAVSLESRQDGEPLGAPSSAF